MPADAAAQISVDEARMLRHMTSAWLLAALVQSRPDTYLPAVAAGRMAGQAVRLADALAAALDAGPEAEPRPDVTADAAPFPTEVT